ncbi:hypothetical protein M404DRAFT_171561 [Pisolithus tinctorius Marx 270]|uniref:Uncharacterized protein n=1 Tax=Pisolithus tinctorius Marx 270 TaxID=870435 RepID=A0A0C3NBI4_PISTI|nr:hypothetical protein M404DRAFT_171561 [Pisolithus tinctorius Marx 270]
MLYAPISQGRKGVLNLQVQNEAIEMVWLKKLLSPHPPAWTPFAHELLRIHATPSPTSKPKARVNYFLQSWPIAPSKLPPILSHCITLARKYNLTLDALFFHPASLDPLPVWFHTSALLNLKKLNNYFYAHCIRDHHNVTNIGEIQTLANTPFNDSHRCLGSCVCKSCNTLHDTARCLKPFKCVETALNITRCIPKKWSPSPIPPRKNPDLLLEEKDALTFNPALTEAGPIENSFHILRPAEPQTNSPATQLQAPDDMSHPTVEISYGLIHKINDDREKVSCGSAFFAHKDPQNLAFRMISDCVTSKTSILCAIIESVRRIDHFVPILAHISSESIVRNLTINLPRNEDSDWYSCDDAHLYRSIVAILRLRSARTHLQAWSAKTPCLKRSAASSLAKEALTHPSLTSCDVSINPHFSIQGLRVERSVGYLSSEQTTDVLDVPVGYYRMSV